MKRTFARALAVAALIAVAGASAFAQLTFNGYYRAGVLVDQNKDNRFFTTAPENVMSFTDRLRLNISYAASDDMYGFKSRLEGSSNVVDSKSLPFTSGIASAFTTVKYGYGYAKFLDGMIKFNAGKLDIGDYTVGQNTGNLYLGNVYTDEPTVQASSLLTGAKGNTTGAMIQAWPIENLSVAATVRTGNYGSADYKPHHFGLDAYYMVPGIGKALFVSNLGNYAATPLAYGDTDGSVKSTANKGDSVNAQESLDKSFTSLGFSYTAFPGLVATAAYRYNGYVKNDDGKYSYANGAIAIAEYTSGPFFASLAGDLDLTNSHSYVEGEASYLIIPQVKVRGYFGWTDSTLNCFNKINLNGGPATLAGVNQYNNSLMGVDVVLPVGKSETSVGLAYFDKDGFQIPIMTKINF